MKFKYLVATSVAVLLAASSAQAADVVKANMVGEVAPLKVASANNFAWSGAYLGLLGGFSHSATSQTLLVSASQEKKDEEGKFNKGLQTHTAPNAAQNNYNLGLVGGYNHAFANGLVVGVEADAFYTVKSGDLKLTKAAATNALDETKADFDVKADAFKKLDEKGAATEDKLDDFDAKLEDGKLLTSDLKKASHSFNASLSARAGYAVGNFLPFVTAGVKASSLEKTTKGVKDYNSNVKAVKDTEGAEVDHSQEVTAKEFALGYAVGAGVDYAVTKNVVLRAEYRFSAPFSKASREYSYQRPVESDKKAQDVKATYTDSSAAHDLRVGVTYKF